MKHRETCTCMRCVYRHRRINLFIVVVGIPLVIFASYRLAVGW